MFAQIQLNLCAKMWHEIVMQWIKESHHKAKMVIGTFFLKKQG